MNQYDPLRSYMHNWFLGVHVKQFFVEFLIWEKFFIQCGPLSRIVELGAGQGGFSFYLFLQAKKRRASFDTWDIAPIHVATTHWGKEFGFSACCHQGDILNDEDIINDVKGCLGGTGKTLLFCDNGHKISEVKMYVPELKPGDYLAVHDWGHEIFPVNLEGLSLKQVEVEHTDITESWTRFFEVTND